MLPKPMGDLEGTNTTATQNESPTSAKAGQSRARVGEVVDLPKAAMRQRGGRLFQVGNQAARGRRTANPIELMNRQLKRLYFELKRGEREAHVTNAMVNILKLQLELMDRFEIGERFAYYEQKFTQLEARFQRLATQSQQNRV